MAGLFKTIDPLAGVITKAPDPLRDTISPVIAKVPKLPDPLLQTASKAGAPVPPVLAASEDEFNKKTGYG